MECRDDIVIMMKEENIKKGFHWRDMLKPFDIIDQSKKPQYKRGEQRYDRIVHFICKRFIELAMKDIIEEGYEVVIKDRGKDALLLAINDFKDISKKYRYRPNCRGHFYFFHVWMFPWMRDRIRGYKLYVKMTFKHRKPFLDGVRNGTYDYEPINLDRYDKKTETMRW
jgi:hypothetical protein